MGWRQDFITHSLPLFFLQHSSPQSATLTPQSPRSLYDLYWHLLSLAEESGVGEQAMGWLWVEREELRQYRLEGREGIGGVVRELQYVHRMMLQLMLRMLRLGWLCRGSGREEEAERMVKDIAEIYPVVKTQISIAHPNLSLHKFIDKYLSQLQGPLATPLFLRQLQKLKQQCQIIGPTEHTIQQFIAHARQRLREKTHSRLTKPALDLCSHSAPTASSSSEPENTNTANTTKRTINEAILFRGKKSRPLANKNNTQSHSQPGKTPVKAPRTQHKHTPSTQQSLLSVKSPTPPTPIFKKIRKDHRKTSNRTLYFGDLKQVYLKRAQPAQTPLELPCLPMSQPSSTSLPCLSLSYRSVQAGRLQGEGLESNGFEVEQTPRPMPRVLGVGRRTASMDGGCV